MNYCLILGGTAGLGYELYRDMSTSMNCIVVGRRATQIFSKGDLFLQADLRHESDVRRLIGELENVTKGTVITDFFWVSGVLQRASSLTITPEQILNMIDVNLRHPILVASWVWQHMHAIEDACRYTIIASSTGLSDAPRDDEAVYAAVKAGQVAFARAIGKQSRDQSKKVSLFCPGGMQTEFWASNPIEQSVYSTFLEPAKVAHKILSERQSQMDTYFETVIPRGSL